MTAPKSTPDEALRRLREMAERIRRRAGQLARPGLPPEPHWQEQAEEGHAGDRGPATTPGGSLDLVVRR